MGHLHLNLNLGTTGLGLGHENWWRWNVVTIRGEKKRNKKLKPKTYEGLYLFSSFLSYYTEVRSKESKTLVVK